MQPLSPPAPGAKSRWLGFAAAGSFAAFAVWLAVQQLTSARIPDKLQGKGVAGRNRGPAPEFWLSSHAAGRERAQATGKPIFLVIRCEP